MGKDYLNLLNKVFAYIIEIVKKLNIPHVNEKTVNAPRG